MSEIKLPSCPKCGAVMEVKIYGDPFGAIIGGNELSIFQCPACKNIEVGRAKVAVP